MNFRKKTVSGRILKEDSQLGINPKISKQILKMKKLQKYQKGLIVPELATGTADAKPEVRKMGDAQTGNHDSDSGLDTTSIGSQKNIKQPDAPPDASLAPPLTPEKSDSGVTSDSSGNDLKNQKLQKLKPKKQYDSRRRRIPKLGLSIKQNPDLSFIRRKAPPRCISCDSDLCQRQSLVKTNGILFMKRREKELLNQENRNYESVWDCAFTRSDIVADWTDDLKDHQDFCDQEIRTSLRYQRKYYEKQKREFSKNLEFDENDEHAEIDTGQKSLPVSEETTSGDTPLPLRRENSKRISKIEEKLKKMKSKVQNTMKIAKNNQNPIITGFSEESEFLPPPTARPKVKTRPVLDENFEINFSGKLQSTVLRLHCENCVLRDKPEEFQSVLFVCQL